jgi:hypothetical protein
MSDMKNAYSVDKHFLDFSMTESEFAMTGVPSRKTKYTLIYTLLPDTTYT